jgi:hypothetical protein
VVPLYGVVVLGTLWPGVDRAPGGGAGQGGDQTRHTLCSTYIAQYNTPSRQQPTSRATALTF